MIIGNTKGFIRGKALSVEGHTHDDRYYTENETNSLLAGKAASSHTHDDRYYTESETNNLLNTKANSSHTHTMDQITNLINEINSLKSSVSEGKALIAAAVTGKGVSTAADASFQTIANNINAINISIINGYKTMSFNNQITGYIPTLTSNPSYGMSYGSVDISRGSATLYIENPSGQNNTVTFSFSF